jgi:hypothetical protein
VEFQKGINKEAMMGIKLNLDVERELCLTIRTLKQFEQHFNLNLRDDGLKDKDGNARDLSFEEKEYLFFLMLQVKDKDITLEQAGDLMELDKMPTIEEAMTTLMGAGKDSSKNAQTPDGSTSGRSE